MNHKNKRPINRRQLLKIAGGTAGVAALAPFVPTLEDDAVAQLTSQTRYLFWYTPTMPPGRLVDPLYQPDEGTLKMRDAWEPLNEVADKLLLIRNLNNIASKENSMTGGHKSSGITLLSGWPIINVGGTGYTDLAEGKGLGHSTLDQWMADQITDTPLSSLTFWHPAGGNFFAPNVWRSISSRNGLFVGYHDSPRAVFNTLFPLTDIGSESTNIAMNEKSLLDHMYGSVERVRKKVSTVDSQRIEAHLDAIRSIEKKLETPQVTCETLDETLSSTPTTVDKAQDLYIELTASAFSCGLTRIAGGMFHSHINNNYYSFLKESLGNFHQTTHGDGPGSNNDKDSFMLAVLRFRANQFVKLIKKLEKVQDPLGGTVLDNTIVHWMSEVGKDHAWHDLPTFVTSGGTFKTGQMIKAQPNARDSDAPLNRLHTSIARAMGFDIDHFGDPRFGEGELRSDAFI